MTKNPQLPANYFHNLLHQTVREITIIDDEIRTASPANLNSLYAQRNLLVERKNKIEAKISSKKNKLQRQQPVLNFHDSARMFSSITNAFKTKPQDRTESAPLLMRQV